MTTPSISADTVSGEALYILKNLRENTRLGRSNKLADVKAALEPAVTLEFDSYFFFLRKFHYIAMDREAQLKLTDQGEQVVDGDSVDKLNDDAAEFFADQLALGDERTQAAARPPAPPGNEVFLEDNGPPPLGRARKTLIDDGPPPVGSSFPSRSEVERPAAPAVPPLTNPLAGASPKGTDLDQRYTKFEALGAGPLGSVFRGRHNALGLDICVKELKDIFGYFSFLQRGEVIKRLKKELCAQAQVRHSAVVAVLDQSTELARPFYVTELMQGSLKERLDEAGGKGLEVGQAIRFLLQAAYGLRAAHASGLTHHNIKPENVLFDAYGNVKLSDFGLSRVIEVDQSKGMPQVFVGTGGMGYMAPELLARSKDVGPAADVYGLGILLYEMLTGQLPGRRSPLPSEVRQDIPSKLDPIFDKMTQDRRENRYPDFDAVLEDFYAAFSEGEYLHRGDLILSSEPLAGGRSSGGEA